MRLVCTTSVKLSADSVALYYLFSTLLLTYFLCSTRNNHPACIIQMTSLVLALDFFVPMGRQSNDVKLTIEFC